MKHTPENFKKALADWLARASKIAQQELTMSTGGRKYIRIIDDGSAFCFIDKSNGDVLMSASWSAPAKHARGNIYKIGQEGVDRYGAHYIK